MAILVQSFLNSATKLSTTATTATTVAQLKTLVNAIEGVSTSIMQFYIVNPSTTSTALVSGTLGSYGITTATTIYSSNTISTLAIASGSTITEDFSPAHTNTEIVDPYSSIWSLNYSPIGLGVTNDVSYKLYATLLGEGSAITLTSHYGDLSVTAGNFLYDTYGASIGIIKGNTTIDNYMAKAAALVTQDNTIVSAATYKGTWDAFSDTPTLTDGVGTLGDAYDVTVAGTSGAYPEYVNQDWRIYDGATWVRVDHTITTEWTIAPAATGQADKATRQLAKLELAQLRRQAGGDTSSTFYRAHNIYDITQLPTQYDGNDIIDNPNEGGLIEGRPWATSQVYTGLTFTYGEATISFTLAGGIFYNVTVASGAGGYPYGEGVVPVITMPGNQLTGGTTPANDIQWEYTVDTPGGAITSFTYRSGNPP